MSYESMLEKVRELLEAHNVGCDDPSDQIKVDGFFVALKKQGATTEAALQAATWEDLQDCGLPKILARAVARVLREDDEEKEEKVRVVKIDDPVSQAESMPPLELLGHFDPSNPTSVFAKKLKEAVGADSRFVVFVEGEYDGERTKELLGELLMGHPQRSEILVHDVVCRPRKIGDLPDVLVDENPFRPGVSLLPDGTSRDGVDWSDVDRRIKQLVYVMVRYDTGEMRGKDEHDVAHFARSHDWLSAQNRLRKAAAKLAELEEEQRLPQLKVRLGRRKGNSPWLAENTKT